MKVQKQWRMTQGELERLDERVFSFICSYQLREGRAPSREEVAQSLGLPSIMTAQRAVKRLREKKKNPVHRSR